MSLSVLDSLPKSRLKALLDHFGRIDDPRQPSQVAHPLPEVLLLVVCGTICDCESYELIAEWGKEHLAVLRQYQPYYHGVPGGRWLTILMNRINPALFQRLAEDDGLKGALVTIDAVATNATIASEIRAAEADYLLAVKANQPTLRAEVAGLFAESDPATLDTDTDFDKGHGRIEQRTVTVARQVDWLEGARRFPGELRLPDVACVVKVASRTELKDRCRFETRYFISSAPLTAARAAEAVRGHWRIENNLHSAASESARAAGRSDTRRPFRS